MRSGWTGTAVVLIMVASAAGCTSDKPLQSATSTPSAAITANEVCQIVKVSLGDPIEAELAITVARQVRIGAGGSTPSDTVTLYDEPVRPAITWTSGDSVTESEVWSRLTDSSDVNTESSPGVAAVDDFLSGLDRSVKATYVGYGSVIRLKIPVTLECGDSRTREGVLTTWDDSEIGVVRCDLEPRSDAPAAARQSYANFCN